MITIEKFTKAAETLGCDVAAIRAVNAVESRGAGFLEDGRIKILFEPHIFFRELQRAGINPNLHVQGNEDIIYPNRKPGKYGPETAQWGRLNRAMAINMEAAMLATSWGAFQIMGFNHLQCGFSSVELMADELQKGEGEQLTAFVNYIRNEGLAVHLQKKDWPMFALKYNGPGYKGSPYTTDDDYDLKLAAAYKKFST